MKLPVLSCFVALATFIPAGAMADITLYGKANLSLEYVDHQEDSFSELMSNASRLGFKGKEKIHDTLEAIYLLEYQVDVEDADTFSQRNIYVGLKGGFGQVIAGHFDTPLKSVQGKVDVFNDLRGDITRMITNNEHRLSNSVMYSTPSLGGFSAHLAYINSEQDDVDDGKSLALSYTLGGLYLGAAFEQDVVQMNSETLRLVVTYAVGGLQLGAFYEEDEQDGQDSTDGWLVSALYGFQSRWVVKAQYGQSDMRYVGGDTASVGVDYKFTNNFTLYSFYNTNSADNDAMDQAYLAVGVDLKFN